MAGGVGSRARISVGATPIFSTHGKGAHLWDVDGNEYIDFLLGFGPLILGHCPPAVTHAVRAQLDRGTMFGTCHELEIAVSKRIVELVPSIDLVNFHSTGSEAVQTCLRLARAFTGRNKIIKFEGNYHGWIDNVYCSLYPGIPAFVGLDHAPRKTLSTPGQPESSLDEMIILPWNDLDAVEGTLRARYYEIAGIIMEPIMANSFVISPKPGYLDDLRKLTEQYGVVLIFDEVITGFRAALGGAQEYYGVHPDLTVLGKALGGGYPISAYGGKKEIMSLAADLKVVFGGTYNSNPLVMAAADATLGELSRGNGAIYQHMRQIGRRLKTGLKAVADRNDIPLQVQGPDTFFSTIFSGDPVNDFRSGARASVARAVRFRAELLSRGVHIFPYTRGLWYISTAHTQEDVEYVLQVIEDVMPLLADVKDA